MMKPTVGRIVWYRAKLMPGSSPQESPEQAAIVTYVHNDHMINVAVFAHNGDVVPMTSVVLLQDTEAPPIDHGYCEWMPYQKQAVPR